MRDEEPTEADLWGLEQLEAHARELARSGASGSAAPRVNLQARLRVNATLLEQAYLAIVAALREGRAITPAAEWLVDNFHVISEQVTDIPLRLTPRLWRTLPAADDPSGSGWPRIFLLARAYVRHTDCNFDADSFTSFLVSYQQVTQLTMRELWALYPILRIALIDELRRLAVRVESALEARAAADALANSLVVASSATVPLKLPTIEASHLGPYVVQLSHRLQSAGEQGQALRAQLAARLAVHGTTIDAITQREHARRGASNLSVRNIMTSLRALAAFDWRSLFDKTSRVEQLLREQESYRLCDRRTRDRYRSSIEDLSRAIRREELDVAAEAIRLLGKPDGGAIQGKEPAAGDIGAVLIGPRRLELEQALHFPVSLQRRMRRFVIRHATPLYFGGVVGLTLLLTGLALYCGLPDVSAAWQQGAWLPAALLGVCALFPASELAIGFVNRQLMWRFKPRHLPRLALEQGLSEDMKTLVVIPVLLRTVADAQELTGDLNVHALANKDPQLRFALLSDWSDSPTETRPDDGPILDAAIAAVQALNAASATAPGGEPRFYLFHRRRLWNERERCFMGWERKRGKLEELNQLLLGRGHGSFIATNASGPAVPAGIRYVLTLDADTRLPLGAVRELVGIAAHPLNRPVIGEQRRVVRGYGVLQPRITPTLPSRDERSLYRDIITSGSGIDPYAAAVSDVYQDVFGEGLFTGKGLYDLAAFDAALAGRVPDNMLLSHDLFEGLFARCGLVTDVELFEDFPSHSEIAAARAHRWIRGDWQLLPWILGARGNLPPLARWKMLDNLRRSLLPPMSMALLVAAASLVAARPLVWLLVALSPWLWPALTSAFQRLPRKPAAQSLRTHLKHLGTEFIEDLERTAVALGLLAQNAWLSLDAIGRVLLRLTVTRRRLLEWMTAAQLKASSSHALTSFVWPLKSASIIVIAATASVVWFNPAALPLAAPLLAVWWLSPLLARYLSRPLDLQAQQPGLSIDAERGLRGIARLTWHFFERFVTAEDNFLPPDNFQETPAPVVAHRSSPTNFGLYLLSVTAARDFGWLGVSDLSQRLLATLDTLEKLERFQGHFYNWYDTRSLAPLLPRYVSTVDSGNLAGHLLTLCQAVDEIEAGPLLATRALTGSQDALQLCNEALLRATAFVDTGSAHAVQLTEFKAGLQELRQLVAATPATLPEALRSLTLAGERVERLEDAAAALAEELPLQFGRVAERARMVHADLDSSRRDLLALLPQAGTRVPHDSRGSWALLEALLPRDVSLPALVAHHGRALAVIAQWSSAGWTQAERAAQASLAAEIESARARATALLADLAQIRVRSRRLVDAMDFGFLFDRRRGLFSIGYRVADHTLDSGYYDLLASEARLASLVSIARGDVPPSHWFKLGRRLTGGSRLPVLASWSGSMFEYLMPALVMREPRDSLLEQTGNRVVDHQIEYGREHGLPWGVSESAYNVRDRELTYQYSGFGVPSLGLKRGLGADYVIAPYATALAAMYQPELAWRNFQELSALSGRGEYGYYEAIDFTPARVPDGLRGAVVRAYMAHHQGMSLVALDNTLHDRRMQARFHADPLIKAAELLLQERSVRFADAPVLIEADVPMSHAHEEEEPDLERMLLGTSSPTPIAHLLSNRNYAVMFTDAGGGRSSCRSLAVTRWREDSTQDCWGSFIYLRETTSGHFWSAGFQPTAVQPDDYEAFFKEERVTLSRRDGAVATTLDVLVATEDDGELRRVTLRNTGLRSRTIEVTSYAEIVLAPQRADIAHPGFSNLFVQTEFVQEHGALLATRRPRSSTEAPVWAVHVVCSQGGPAHLEYETDRMRFIGRGRSVRSPVAIQEARPLSNTVGNVLDPIFSLRTRVTVTPEQPVTVTFATLVATSRSHALSLASKYRNPAIFDHVADFAWTFARAELHYLQSNLAEAALFQALGSHLIFASRQLRAGDDVLAANRLDVSHLWRFAISGDKPILVVRSQSLEDQGFIRQCLRAQEYWRIKSLHVDIVVLNELQHSYIQDLQDAIERTVRSYAGAAQPVAGDDRGVAFALRADSMNEAELTLLFAVARVVLSPAQGGLAEQLRRPAATSAARPRQEPARASQPVRELAPARPVPSEFFNGLGGFVADGREYLITLEPGRNTPAPWSNVLANESFGSLVTESGSMCTWSLNSRENQLTPWSNDPVSDPSGEAFYIHDSQSGQLWSPTPLPVRLVDARYEVRHGQGYSRYIVATHGIETELTVFVAAQDPVKVCRLRLTNRSTRSRRLTVASYVEWALGASRAGNVRNVITSIDSVTGAMFASNPALMDFGGRVAFCDLGGRQTYGTGSRHEFLGRNGSIAAPAGMFDVENWSARVGAGLDPCCAWGLTLDLEPDTTEDIVLVLGQAATADEARQIVQRYRRTNLEQALFLVTQRWDELLGAAQIRTPDRALDLLFNRWLLYQTISCRLWGRAGFYQAGGAYGFRDQLQDGMALTLGTPAMTRAHLLRAAARQYLEGDVQHWWHPPTGRGVRTHFSDDRIWLPYATFQYVDATADYAVLDEIVPFIEGPPLPIEREDSHYTPAISATTASLYEHCARALDVSLRTGVHKLPLMGGGDWNDGMNRVGHEGRGESVWLAWFLITTLRQFIPVARQRGDVERLQRWQDHAAELTRACEEQAWDGAWYRRAYFDDGTPLGSAANAECRIDSLAQSWAVLSGAAEPQRAEAAMQSVEQYLVKSGDGMVLLFTPPFDKSPTDPGYIKGYLPGLRENGGQYTHAAIWVLMAQAVLRNEAQVGSLLDMLNPVRRSDSRTGMQAYRVEPYVLAADIYSSPPHARRGGWTWYTGASGWMYRAILENVLGIQIRGNTLSVKPCMPSQWNGFEVELKPAGADYLVRVERVRNAQEVAVELDGVDCNGASIPLLRDGVRHVLRVAVE